MPEYDAPVKDMRFVMKTLAGLDAVCAHRAADGISEDVVLAAMEEAAKLASAVFSPLNRVGDLNPARVENKAVIESEGFSEAYKQFCEGGWAAMPCSAEFGGMGMPELVAAATSEMWASSNMAFSLCPMLTMGAIAAIEKHGSEDIKQAYLPKMVNGEWTGTMNLTEPQAGSDLAAVRAKAVPEGEHYRISGTKIFITWGDHQMTDNIIHLVLARTPDAPEGVKGISLFVVPKFMVNEDGSLGERNDVYAGSVEHKMGIHASPTCVMNYGENDGAVGYLLGEENKGLLYMFVMMNAARLHVGIEGVALSERAYQHAVSYARERVQGAPLTGGDSVAIINHPDVRRMLLQMRALTEASRALTYVLSAEIDKLHQGDENAQARIEYMTPIAKGWSTEIAQEVTSLAVQLHGGMGFIEETGVAQYMRDARITTIYEGTTGIQAMDLTGRKLVRDMGKSFKLLVGEFTAELQALPDDSRSAGIVKSVAEGLELLTQAAKWLGDNVASDFNLIGSAAFHFLMLNGTVLGGFYMAKSATAALANMDEDSDFSTAKLATARFYAEHIMPRASSHAVALRASTESVMSLDESLF